MLIEKSPVRLGTFRIAQSPKGSVLTSGHVVNPLLLTSIQVEYLNYFSQKLTIEQIIRLQLKEKRQVHFKELFDLLKLLVENRIVLNGEFRNYFEDISDQSQNLLSAPIEGKAQLKEWTSQSLLSLPFFRTQSDIAKAAFLRNCSLFETPERTKLISIGNTDRDLFVLLQGEASIYRLNHLKRRELITNIPAGSVFGEGAFLLGQQRTADVITNVHSVLARICYVKEDFEPIIKAQPPDSLQKRFWILHGLLSSPIFHSVPSETLDLFMYSGTGIQIPQGETICQEASEGTSFFVVIQGEIGIQKFGRLIKTLKQGDIFGEIALMISDGVRTASAVANKDCLLLEVKKEEFFGVLSTNLVLGKEIETLARKRMQAIDPNFGKK